MGKSLKAAPIARRPAPKKIKTLFATKSTEPTEKSMLMVRAAGQFFVAAALSDGIRRSRIGFEGSVEC